MNQGAYIEPNNPGKARETMIVSIASWFSMLFPARGGRLLSGAQNKQADIAVGLLAVHQKGAALCHGRLRHCLDRR
jgi:hypothetical protein